MNAQQQKGMTTLGLLIMVAFVGLFVYAGIRLIPVYLEHMKIQSVMQGVKSEFDGQNPSRKDIGVYIQKRFDVESVNIIGNRDIKIKRDGEDYVVSLQYDNTTPFIANVQFMVSFEKEVRVRK